MTTIFSIYLMQMATEMLTIVDSRVIEVANQDIGATDGVRTTSDKFTYNPPFDNV
jgi:hypothetical protein